MRGDEREGMDMEDGMEVVLDFCFFFQAEDGIRDKGM